MSQLEESLYALDWNNNISVAVITLILYDYILQFEKEVTFVWARPRSMMTCLYLAVRYFGIFLALYVVVVSSDGLAPAVDPDLALLWDFSVDAMELFCIFLLGGSQSKPILYVLLGLFLPVIAIYVAMDIYLWSRPSAISVQEITITSNIKYCTAVFHIGPMPAIYASIPVICYDVFLVILAIVVLGKHLKERKVLQIKPNAYVVMIVRYHIIYFVMNLASQIFMAILWAGLPTVVMNLVLLFNDTAPFIIVPRLIISIWDTHARDNCAHSISTTFEDCACWTSPPTLEWHEADSSV
ncbi:hypothetical protein BDR04DRAFT_1114711 [Suillus decipiens]|nr:hypothetical protein BDR04DRAFT_1114711 [Suillus decipiens]